MTTHYLKQCWIIVIWTLGSKFQWNFNCKFCNILVQENGFENIFFHMAAILSWPQCVYFTFINRAYLRLGHAQDITSNILLRSHLHHIILYMHIISPQTPKSILFKCISTFFKTFFMFISTRETITWKLLKKSYGTCSSWLLSLSICRLIAKQTVVIILSHMNEIVTWPRQVGSYLCCT